MRANHEALDKVPVRPQAGSYGASSRNAPMLGFASSPQPTELLIQSRMINPRKFNKLCVLRSEFSRLVPISHQFPADLLPRAQRNHPV